MIILNLTPCPLRTARNQYEDRLLHRKIHDAMMRLHGLKISPATILDLTRRAADAVQSEYDAILNRIRGALIVYADETSNPGPRRKTLDLDLFYAIRNLFCD